MAVNCTRVKSEHNIYDDLGGSGSLLGAAGAGGNTVKSAINLLRALNVTGGGGE